MVTSQSYKSNPAHGPALGIRVLVLMALGILLMVLDHRQHYMDTVRRTIGVVVYPIQLVVDAPFRFWEWLSDGTTARNDMQLEISRLQTERLLTNGRLQRLIALEAENDRLRALLEARPQERYEIRVAEIMAVHPNPYHHSFVINIGERDGVYDSQPIIDADGVVGQVINTGIATSEALLISDLSHSLPVQVNRNGLRTVANGSGNFDRLDLPFLPNNADIEPGDLLVTSGLGGAFPAGYPVAVVATVDRIPQQAYADVTAIPSSALDQVREVMLIWSSPNAATVDDGDESREPDD